MDFMHDFTECSVSLWLKILSWNTSYATYFQFGLGSTPWAHYIFGLLRNSSASTLCFTISNGSSATNANCLTPALELNTWYHLTLTYANGHCKIYVNGVETKDYSTTIVPNFSGITTGTIGAANNLTGYQTNCLINDFRVYDHCLSAAEVREIAQGLVLHYKLDDIMHGIQDSSGYNHNGTINGNIVISSDTNRYNYSAQFDGVDDSITVPYNAICPENIFTFNLWFKKDALGSKNYETLFGGPGGFEMDTRAGSATTLSLYMASTRSTKRNLVTELSLGNWYMITMTRDGTKEKYYVNGIYQSEIDAKAMPTGIYRIGAWASNTGQNYYGLISDFRIYCTALSAQEIKQLYELGMKIDNSHNLHAFEVVENNNKISLNNKRQFKCDEVVESESAKFFKREDLVEVHQIVEF